MSPALKPPSLALRQIVEQVAAEQRLLEAAAEAAAEEAEAMWAMKKASCSGYIGDYTTPLCEDYNEPL